MRIKMKEKLLPYIKAEKAQLAVGEFPQPRLKNRIQRIAMRLLLSFFLLTLILTIASRAAASFTTARVSVDTMKSGYLTNRAVIEGTIEPLGDISLSFPEGLKVEEVYVKEGQRINEGDKLLAFNLEKLESLIESIDEKINIKNLEISSAQNIVSGQASDGVLSAQQELDDAQSTYTRLIAAQERNQAWAQQDYQALQVELVKAQEDYSKAVALAKNTAIENAQADLTAAQQYLESVRDSSEEELRLAQEKADKASENLEAVKLRSDFSSEDIVVAAQSRIDVSEQALKTAQRESETIKYSNEEELYNAQKAIEAAQRNLESAQKQAETESREESAARTQNEIIILTYQSELKVLDETRNELQEIISNGGVLTAPVTGTILKIIEKGAISAADVDSVLLTRDDEGFVFEGYMDQAAAEKFSISDTGQLTYLYKGESKKLDVEIASMGVADEDKMTRITVNLPKGSYSSGSSGELTITKKGVTQDSCLPLAALRNDAGGDFVLVLREQKTVMGTEWIVDRVEVSVKDKDSETMSIEGSLSYNDKVVVSSNKPISKGDKVRIEGK